MAEKKFVKLYYYYMDYAGQLVCHIIDAVETPKQYKIIHESAQGFYILRDVVYKRELNTLMTDSGLKMFSTEPNGALYKKLLMDFYNKKLKQQQETVAKTTNMLQQIASANIQ